MQTTFTPEQLKDPGTARSNEILRSCVHCGFCTATCPTYQVLGDELDSPRGRIYLIKDMLESGRDADERTVRHVDRCLSCLACMTTCPSGVHYMHLIDEARAYIERSYTRPWHDRALRFLLAKIVPYPGRFRLAMRGAQLARPFAKFLPDARLRAMVSMAPPRLPKPSPNDLAQVFPANGARRFRVALQIGCAQRALNTDINDATIRLLQRLGNALEQLSERQQRIFILSRLHGQGYAEIAAELGVSASTVQKELKLIMTLCMTLLERLAPPT